MTKSQTHTGQLQRYDLPRRQNRDAGSLRLISEGVMSGCPSLLNELDGCLKQKSYGNKRRHELERVRKGNAGRSQKGPGVVNKTEGNHG